MMEDPKKILDGFRDSVAQFSEADEETLKAFTNLNETVLQSGALDRKTKMLMCLAIGIANGSEYCVVPVLPRRKKPVRRVRN